MSPNAVPRRTDFVEGIEVRLADGRSWMLPPLDRLRNEPEFGELMEGLGQAEDRSERLRAELALTIYLLRRNYDLAPEALMALLTFAPGDTAQVALQEAVSRLAADFRRRLASSKSDSAADSSEVNSASPHRVEAIRSFRTA